jgi:hypothetical protein
MKKGLLHITGEQVRKVLREALTPTFLVILAGSTLVWYASRLSGEYTTGMPLSIRIDGEKYRLTATVTGRGSAILAQKLSLKRRLSFTLDELSSRPSRETPGALTITGSSLKTAINGKISDLSLVEVTSAPEFIPPAVEEKSSGDYSAAETPKARRQRERLERREAKAAEKEARRAARKAESETPEATE